MKIKILNKGEKCLFNFLTNSNSIKNLLNTDFWREYFYFSNNKKKSKIALSYIYLYLYLSQSRLIV